MDTTALLQQLQAERPDLIPAVKAAIAAGGDRDALNTILLHLLQMQGAIEAKRRTAKDLIIVRTGLAGGAAMSLHHIPDVTLRKLCQIAEVKHLTNAKPEWLDAMEERENSRTLTRYEHHL